MSHLHCYEAVIGSQRIRSANIGIIGFGRGGQSLAKWLIGKAKKITVSDRRSAKEINISLRDYPGVHFIFEDSQNDLPMDWNVVFISGGVPKDHPYILSAISNHLPVTNDAQIFLDYCPAPVIGITGSAGKTTTTTLLGDMMREQGHRVWVGGNIGHVLLDDLKNIQTKDVVVMELSSFQLEWMKSSPPIAAILNLTPNHLDRHGSLKAYIEAKFQIMRWHSDNDWVVLSSDDANCIELSKRANGKILWFGLNDTGVNGVFLNRDFLCLRVKNEPIQLIHKEEIPLRGKHNLSNVMAACAVAHISGVEFDAMVRAIRTFQPVAHRLQHIRNLGGVSYVNDSIATSPERVMAAIASFTEPIILLLGGQDKDLPWQPLLEQISDQVRAVIVFGEAAPMIHRQWVRMERVSPPFFQVKDLAEATKLSSKLSQVGDIVLLSPGGTSYDAYLNFEERGCHFHELVMSL